MKKYFAYIIASLVITFSLVACNKGAQVVNANSYNTSSTALLPLTVGNMWLYQDSIYDSTHTLQSVSIDTAQVINQSVNVGGSPFWGVVETDTLGCFDNGAYLTNYLDQYGNYDILELDSSYNPYLFWGSTTVNGSQLVQTFSGFTTLSCAYVGNIYGFTANYTINGYTNCYSNVLQYQDCKGTLNYITYVSAGVGVVRYEIWDQPTDSTVNNLIYSQTLQKFIHK